MTKTAKFHTNNYMVVYEELMKVPDARANFHEFLKQAHNEEPILFLNDVDEYRTLFKKTKEQLVQFSNNNTCMSPTNSENGGEIQNKEFDSQCNKMLSVLVDGLKNILDTYIGGGKPKELNLSKPTYQPTLDSFEKLTGLISQNDMKPMGLISLLDPFELFDRIESHTILDLKYDQFPRYARSHLLSNFLLKKGEDFTRSIALNVSNGYSVDVRFKPNDFKSQLMTEKDVFFAYTLAEDTPDWKELTYSEKPNMLQTFVSKTSYVIGQEKMKGMKLFKLVMHLPYAAEDVWATYCDMDTRFRLDETLMKDFKLLRYIPPSAEVVERRNNTSASMRDVIDRDEHYTVDNPPLALQIGALGIDMHIPLLKNRDLPHTMTSVYDPSTNCYMNIGHTCAIEEELRPARKDRVDAEILFNYMFYRMGDNSTRFIHTVYTDLHVVMDSDLVLNRIWKKRSKQLQNGFETLLAEKTDKGTKSIDVSKINDHFQYMRAVDENLKLNRNWYAEYQRKKSSSSTGSTVP